MRSVVRAAARYAVLPAMVSAGWLLSAEFFPSLFTAYGSSAAGADRSEWTTTHSDEPASVPPTAAGTDSLDKPGPLARPQTGRKTAPAQPRPSRLSSTEQQRKSAKTTQAAKPEPVGIQIAKLFRKIGADFEEFFVGTRTVDKDD
ncbi:hypothetical protein [Methylacidimicrobium sp. AP8]|uniref:hypothetical protein n=1 Tax=Methylacidimicrobium sp. AP8 TaxID=2730359 RepID=UPI00192363F5|nr:hypothetical protein [Methylacidimicrobium sp. AP8]